MMKNYRRPSPCPLVRAHCRLSRKRWQGAPLLSSEVCNSRMKVFEGLDESIVEVDVAYEWHGHVLNISSISLVAVNPLSVGRDLSCKLKAHIERMPPLMAEACLQAESSVNRGCLT